MTATEALRVREAADTYRARSRSVAKEALLARVAGRPLTSRIYTQYAAICRRAALAEELDPPIAGLAR